MLGKVVPETGQTWTSGSNHLWASEVLFDNPELTAACARSPSAGPEVEPWDSGFPEPPLESLTEGTH